MNIVNSNTKVYALIGDPISKSLSPAIHNYMYNELNLNHLYLTFNIKKKDLKKGLDSLKLLGIKGFNVTLPHKETIMKYLDEIDESAKKLGAVNTVRVNENGSMIGYNTDGLGFVESLYNEGLKLKGSNILILGAGGAAKSISYNLAEEEINRLYFHNRTEEKAYEIMNNINKKFSQNLCEYYKGNIEDIDIIVNTTSIGMFPDDNMYPINLKGGKKTLVVADAIYKPLETKILREAKKLGYGTINGIGMLVNQGVLSQNIWLSTELDKKINKKVKKYLQGIIGVDNDG